MLAGPLRPGCLQHDTGSRASGQAHAGHHYCGAHLRQSGNWAGVSTGGTLTGIVPEILNQNIYEDIYIVSDEEALTTARDLARKEGVMCGISSGTNVAAAIQLAKKLGTGKTVVTILPDTAERYFSTPLFEGE